MLRRKALFSDIQRNRGLECSAAIPQVASKTPLPAGPRSSAENESRNEGKLENNIASPIPEGL